MPAYNAARWIDETLHTVLGQTRPPDEIIVVDDGSTDDTAARARVHGVTVVGQRNGGPAAAYNRAFDLATSEYVAMCPADDLWHPRKLEWQAEILAEDPAVDVVCGGARYFGLRTGEHPRPIRAGRQERPVFLRAMYAANLVAAPTAVVRRALHQRLGRFDEALPSEDYEFWLRALRHGAVFHFDARTVVELREHGDNVSRQALTIWEMNHRLRRRYADDVGDRGLTRRLEARDLRVIARCRFGLGRPAGARAAYRASLRRRPSLEAALGATLLVLPGVGRAMTALDRFRRRPDRR
jgi:glycosyltransferase involved in cell wall biosynthesis